MPGYIQVPRSKKTIWVALSTKGYLGGRLVRKVDTGIPVSDAAGMTEEELNQLAINCLLDDNKQKFQQAEEKGNRYEQAKYMFSTMEYCLQFGEPIPEWAGQMFLRSAGSWLNAEVRTLDEAFGTTDAAEMSQFQFKRWNHARQIADIIDEFDEAGKPHPWPEIGEMFHRDPDTCRKLYYEYRDLRTKMNEAEDS